MNPDGEKWKKLIYCSNNELTSKSSAYEFHFEEDFVVRNYVHTINGETVAITRGEPILKPDVILTIFSNFPDYHSVLLPKKRKSCK